MAWKKIGSVDDIPVLGSRVIKSSQGDIAVFRNSENQVFALKDECPHKKGPLSQGIVHGNKITCPLHNWVIDMESGEAQGPDEGCTNHYATKIDSGEVFIEWEQA